jgi:TonB family protein
MNRSRITSALLAALLAAPVAVPAGEPTVLIEDPLRADEGEDAQLVTSETLAYRAHRELLSRVPLPENRSIGGPAMIGLSTIPASRVRRGDLPAELRERFEGWDGWGAAILRVVPGSPAEAAWLQAGDVVVRFGGLWVDRDDTLTWLASRAQPNVETEIWYWREGQVYLSWIKPGVRDVVQATGEGRTRPIEGHVFTLDRKGLVPPVLRDETEVDYPSPARRAELGGSAAFVLHVGPDGEVAGIETKRSTGSEALDEAALEALQQRSYEPGRFRGRHVTVAIEVTVTFWPDGPPEIEDEAAAGASTNG